MSHLQQMNFRFLQDRFLKSKQYNSNNSNNSNNSGSNNKQIENSDLTISLQGSTSSLAQKNSITSTEKMTVSQNGFGASKLSVSNPNLKVPPAPVQKTSGSKPHHPIHEETLQLVHQERQITGQVIANLQIIAEKKLYLKIAYGSLFDYCTQYLKYSESCAYRRIAAVKIIKEMPSIIKPLNEGSLSLTNLTQAQVLFKQKPTLSTENKQQILQSLENKSKKQAEQILRQNMPDTKVTADQERFIDADHLELKILIRHGTHQKLQRLRQLRSHKNPQMSYDELLSDMADLLLKKMDPLIKSDPEVKKNNQDTAIKKDSMPNSQLNKGWSFNQEQQSTTYNSLQNNLQIEKAQRNITIVAGPAGAKVLRQKKMNPYIAFEETGLTQKVAGLPQNKKPQHIRFIPQSI
ncbi:MAG: hypothetical protein ACOYOK_16375, partial [Pseudobdellovibrionaceae bacterium]